MERVQARRIFVLSGALVVVSGFLAYDPPARPAERTEVYQPPARIDRIEIEHNHEQTVLVHRNDLWWVGGAVNQAADELEVRRLVDALNALQFADAVSVPNGVDPTEFGLGDPPWARLTIEGPEGSQRIDLGSSAEVGFRSYVRGPDGAILVARAGPHGVVGQPPEAFADRRLSAWPTERITQVDRSGPDGEWSIVRREADILVARQWRGDAERVDAWLRAWTSVRIAPGPFGGPPAGSLTLWLGTEPLRVDFAPGSDGGTQLSLSDGRTGTAALESTLMTLKPATLAARSLLGIDRAATDAVSLTLGRTEWTGRRNGPAWTSNLGESRSWDVVSALATLSQAPPPPGARKRPPTRPWGQITTLQDGQSRTVLVDRDRRGVHLAWWPEATVPVAVPAKELDEVLRELEGE
ncbi:MAG: DUF4340 domain-containing protein [Myxococcota bacterium]